MDKTIVIVGDPELPLPLEGRPGEFAGATPTSVADSHYYRRAILDGDCRLATDAEIAAVEEQAKADAAAQVKAEKARAKAAESITGKEV